MNNPSGLIFVVIGIILMIIGIKGTQQPIFDLFGPPTENILPKTK